MLRKYRNPYQVGETLKVQFRNKGPINAEIVKVFEPFTLSSVLLIRISDNLHLNGQFVLKIYDRRFAFGLRKNEKMAPWHSHIVNQYCDFVRAGRASQFLDMCEAEFRKDIYWADECYQSWSKAEKEAYCQHLCHRIFKTEREAYSLLKSLQGKHIPRVYDEVYLEPNMLSNSYSEHDYRHNHPGMILEYIQGFPLTDLDINIPKPFWQSICDQAISVVHLVGKNGVCNEDLRTRNFIVRLNGDEADFGVFMIDFGKCSFRQDAKDLNEFREWQAHQDEEGAVGRVMETKLGDGYKYEFSKYALQLMDDFMSEI